MNHQALAGDASTLFMANPSDWNVASERSQSLIWTKFRLNRTQPANGGLWRLA